jgi:hypothetical protein
VRIEDDEQRLALVTVLPGFGCAVVEVVTGAV